MKIKPIKETLVKIFDTHLKHKRNQKQNPQDNNHITHNYKSKNRLKHQRIETNVI